MRAATKVWLAVAGSLVLVGCILFVCALAAMQWDFTKLTTGNYETNRYEVGETFRDLSVKTDTADVRFVLADDGVCRVECYEEEAAKHSVTVKDGVLVIEVHREKSWYAHIGMGFRSPKITVSLPETAYRMLTVRGSTGNVEIPEQFTFEGVDLSSSTGRASCYASVSGVLKIKTSTGDIRVGNSTVGALDLAVSTGAVTVSDVKCRGDMTVGVSTGKAYLTDVLCENVTSRGSTGKIVLTRVIAANKCTIERSTGDVRFEGCDAAELSVSTGTGDVTGSLLTEKVFITDTGTGKVDVPRTTTGGVCEIRTDTGRIIIRIG